MPDDANGTHFLPPSYRVNDGDTVMPIQHNPPFEDVSLGLSNRVHKDGRTAWTGNQNANGNRLTGLADGIADSDAATVGQAALLIGDGKWSARELDGTWLRRNGALYDVEDYPGLAALLPPLPDGIEWTLRTSGSAATQTWGLVSAQGRFTATGGANVIASLDNGENWSLRATIEGAVLRDVAFGASVYVAVEAADGRIATSVNGDDWSLSGIINADGIFGAAFLPGDNLFCVVGINGYIGTSDDGATWAPQTSGTSATLWRVRLVNGILVAVGASGTILTSSDGINWTSQTSGTSETLFDVAYADGVYAVCGANGVIRTSTNLTSWTARSSGVSSVLQTIIASSAGFLATGVSGVARISSNGTTWAGSPTGTTGAFRGGLVDPENPARYLLVGPPQTVLDGLRTLPTQFRVPNDNPTYGWIKALNEVA